MKKILVATGVIVLTLLMAAPALAADRVIYNGIDLWTTKGDGSTFADFAQKPIPAGFFCFSSEAFAGKIAFRGVPVATGEAGALGATDTIVQRLDDAVFNKRGVATTRIQMRAMEFESLAPLKTACGVFKARVTLDGEQPITTMRIVRDNQKGGRFFSPIHVNVKITFTPVGRLSTEVLEIRHQLRFPPMPDARWSSQVGKRGVARPGVVLVDTDADRSPDTYLPGTSNFAAGWRVPAKATQAVVSGSCHTQGSVHCTAAAEM
jgi:hypothetical protein